MKQEETTQLAVVVLPEEVQAIALSVSEEKRAEVSNTLSQVFAGTADWKAQVEAIAVSGPDDKLGMKLANAARLNAKNARLAAEKLFDQKRNEVQAQMLSYQTEDKLWLKAKQTMAILFKEIEQAAEYKEKTAERYEAEQHELTIQTRLTKLASVNPDITRQEVDAMSDASFEAFYAGLVAQKAEQEKAAQAEAERIRQIELKKERDDNRFKIFAGTGMIFSNGVFGNKKMLFNFDELRELSDDDFIISVKNATDSVAECKAEEVKEKERLEIIAKEKQKELDQQAEALRVQQENAAKEKAKQDAIIAKQQTDLKAERDRLEAIAEADRKAQADEKAAQELAAKAPKKEKLTRWIENCTLENMGHMESDVTVADIRAKFNGFKLWASKQVEAL